MIPREERGEILDLHPDEDVVVMCSRRGVWLDRIDQGVHASRRRLYFRLVYGLTSEVLKMQYFAGLLHDEPVNLQGSVVLGKQTRITVDKSQVTITNPQRVWHLSADSPSVAEAWAELWADGAKDIAATRHLCDGRKGEHLMPMSVRLQQLMGPGRSAFTLASVTATLQHDYASDAIHAWTRLPELVLEARLDSYI